MAEKWQENDTLRQMTTKFNALIDELEQFKEQSGQINGVTEKKFTELTQTVSQQFVDIGEELSKKIESYSDDLFAFDIEEDTDLNVSDLNRPVSIPQQEAINAAKEAVLAVVADKISSTEIGEEIEQVDDPEVSAPVKEYVNKKIIEALAAREPKAVIENSKLVLNAPISGIMGYDIAGNLNLGMVRPSEDVEVNRKTGAMTTPKINQQIAKLSTDLVQTMKGLVELSRWVGNIPGLHTDSKNVAAAINELVEKDNSNKAELAKILTEKGISCSGDNSWDDLIGSVKVLPNIE